MFIGGMDIMNNTFYQGLKGKNIYQIIDQYLDNRNEFKILYKQKDKDKFFVKNEKDFFKIFKKTFL
jgi:hypothetical protein